MLKTKVVLVVFLSLLTCNLLLILKKPSRKVQYISHHGQKYIYHHDQNSEYLVNVSCPEIKKPKEIEENYFTCAIMDVDSTKDIQLANRKLKHNKNILKFFIEKDKIWAVLNKESKVPKESVNEYFN